MPYQLLADLVLVIHFAFVAFVVCGALLLVKWRRLIRVHLGAVIWAALVEFAGWICPLTPLENWLRRQAGSGDYALDLDFIAHYLFPVLYPQGLTRRLQVALGVALVVINVAIYGWLFRSYRSTKA